MNNQQVDELWEAYKEMINEEIPKKGDVDGYADFNAKLDTLFKTHGDTEKDYKLFCKEVLADFAKTP